MNKDQEFWVALKNRDRYLELAEQEEDKMIELLYADDKD